MGFARTKKDAASTSPVAGEPSADAFVWLESLPIPAAAVRPQSRGQFSIHAANSRFAALGLSPTGIGQPGELTRVLGDAAHGKDQQCCTCRLGDGVSGRDYRVALTRLEFAPDLFLLSFVDRTQELAIERNLRRELVSDSLTGLPNRAGFEDAVEEIAGDSGSDTRDHAVLILDLARFSRINEHIGPMAGDELIITVARRLQSCLRSGDILARTGGDEFAIFSRISGGRADAREIARRVRGAFSHPFRISDLQISVDCAIGAAIQPPGETEIAEQFRHAQIALKRAKQTDRIEIYEPEVVSLSNNRFSLETALRHAIETDGLHLAFQPLVSFATGQVAGFEALARWTSPDGRSVSPGEFIPIAEDSGLIVPLGQWVINEAAATLARWDADNDGAPINAYVAVNVSSIQLVRDDVAAQVRMALARHDITGERLMLELTESAIIGDPDLALSVLGELKALNTRIAMDDFGTGYSNLAYLQRLPIDVLKIDRSFVTDMTVDKDKIAIVRTIQSLAEALGMQTTAEGIETSEQARLLAALGCNYAQGYYFAKPMGADDALAYWRGALGKPLI
jgi:diguanylate cyclase (GGDEF)-like protein